MNFAQGIILRIDDFRERDLRSVLYTKQLGKLELIAKGAKRIEAKLRGNLDILNFIEAGFVEGKNFNILTSADLLDSFPGIVKNVHTYRAALAAVNIVDSIFRENAQDPRFFEVLHYTLDKLDEYSIESFRVSVLYSWLLVKKFEAKVLEGQGYGRGFGDNSLMSELDNKLQLSHNSALLLRMLSGEDIQSVKMSQKDFSNIENVFSRAFRHIFNYNPHSWVPIIA